MSKGEQDKEIDMSFVQEILLAVSAYEQQINDDNIIKYFL